MTDRVQNESTEAVLQRHLDAFAKHDMEATLADYAKSATVVTADGIFQGREEIRGFFEWAFSQLPEGSPFVLDQQFIKDDVAFITWHAESASMRIPLGSDTFVIRDDRIQMQSVTAYMEAKAGA